jgi:predicted Zn finger-like uncharacterized protein
MLIVCPSCATSYDVEAASLEPNGRRVRCVRCRTIWNAETPQAEKLLAAAEAIAPGREAAVDVFGAEAALRPGEADLTDQVIDEPEAFGDPAVGQAAEVALAAAETGDASDEVGVSVAVDAPPLSPVDLDGERGPAIDIGGDRPAEENAEPAEDIESYAARRQKRGRRQPLRWPLSSLQSGVLALLIVDAIIVGWRNDIVRILPQTASFYGVMGLSVNLRGLNFEDIATTTEQHESALVLVVDGNLVNDSRKIVEVPRLKFAVRNPAGDEIYSWTAVPPRTTLPPGEAVAFQSRLASPPPDGHDVVVRFVTRRDIISGAH